MGRTQRENDAWNGGVCAGGGGDGTDGWGWSDARSSRALGLESEQASLRQPSPRRFRGALTREVRLDRQGQREHGEPRTPSGLGCFLPLPLFAKHVVQASVLVPRRQPAFANQTCDLPCPKLRPPDTCCACPLCLVLGIQPFCSRLASEELRQERA